MAYQTYILIHPSQTHLRAFVESVANQTLEPGRIIYQSRNIISVHTYQDIELNVKKYKIPLWFNQFAYAIIRKSKAQRAFEAAASLTEKGIETPLPIAYIEQKKWGLLKNSYLITYQCPYSHNMYEFGAGSEKGREDILRAFGHFTAQIHQAHILHHDYSPGNILFDQIDGSWHFCVVDINRLHFKTVSKEEGLQNFERLWGTPAMFTLMAEGYADAMGYNKDYCIQRVLHYRKTFWTERNRTHPKEARVI